MFAKIKIGILIIIIAKTKQRIGASDHVTVLQGFPFLVFAGCSLITFDDKQSVKCITFISL